MEKLQNTFALIKARLGVTHDRERFMCRCPAHEDRAKSLSVALADSRILAHCFAGCSFAAVVKALDVSPRDLFADGEPAIRAQARAARLIEAPSDPSKVAGYDPMRDPRVLVAVQHVAAAVARSDAKQARQLHTVAREIATNIARHERTDGELYQDAVAWEWQRARDGTAACRNLVDEALAVPRSAYRRAGREVGREVAEAVVNSVARQRTRRPMGIRP